MKKGGIFLTYLMLAALILFLYFHFNLGSLTKEEPIRPIQKISLKQRRFVVEKGDGLKELAGKLKDQGIIKNEIFFQIYAFLFKARNNFLLLPGEYNLPEKITLKKLFEVLALKWKMSFLMVTLHL